MTIAHYTESEHAQAAVQAEVIASSISPAGDRIDTLKIRYPRMVHADFMTHRVFSRNGSSSRAMPSVTLLKDEPYVPEFRHNQPGMQPGAHLSLENQQEAEAIWNSAVLVCQTAAAMLSSKDGLNIHKQWTNRMLEWFGYITVVVTATNWSNYLGLRDHPDAQDEIIWQAQAVKDALAGAVPTKLRYGEWHLPFVRQEDVEFTREFLRTVSPRHLREIQAEIDFAFKSFSFMTAEDKLLLVQSASRCARTSYRNFDGSRMTLEKDVETFLKLGSSPIHASPFEHQAKPYDAAYDDKWRQGNFDGWSQFRKFIPNEFIPAN